MMMMHANDDKACDNDGGCDYHGGDGHVVTSDDKKTAKVLVKHTKLQNSYFFPPP